MIHALERRLFLSSTLQAGTLKITGTAGNNTISLTLVGNSIRVSESGLAAKDYLTSKVSKIVVNALDGNDKVTVANAITRNCEIQGGTGNDTLRGGGGTDALLGQDGNDNLEGGSKNDYLDGGPGSDRVDYSARTSKVTATLKYDGTANTATGSGGGSGGSDAYASIESLSGTPKADTLTFEGGGGLGSSLARTFKIDGLSGNDKIDVSAVNVSSEFSVIAHGGSGDDTVSYFSFQQAISVYGDGGNDQFSQMATDAMEAPIGTRDGGAGYDVDHFWDFGHTKYVTPPGVEEALLTFETLPSVDGNDLDNKLHIKLDHFPTGGPTAINGLGGDDFIEVSLNSYQTPPPNSNVSIRGNSGNDTIMGSTSGDSLYGDTGNDLIYGQAGKDSIEGGSGNDTLYGGSGNDTLAGGSGHDQLFGDAGNDLLKAKDAEKDTLNGGSGTDTAERDKSLDVVTSIETLL